MTKQRRPLVLILGAVAIVIVYVLIGRIVEIEPYEVRLAKPYIDKIVIDDDELRELASAIVEDYGEKEGKVNAIYRYIVEDFIYEADPEYTESIQSPFETLDLKGGDCEDLAILACSLLENIGIKTYLVLTEDHAYALVSGINADNLWTYIHESLEEQFIEDHNMVESIDETFQLRAGYVSYYGGDGRVFPIEAATFGDSVVQIESLEIDYSVSSSEPVNIYILPSKDEFDNLVQRRSFQHYPDCAEQGVYQAQATCEIPRYGGTAIQNPTSRKATVDVEVTFSYKVYFEGLKVTSYTLKGQQAMVLELTAGEYGYPGYSPIVEAEKRFAIDPITKEYFYLE
ncbi:MAG: transglutaminase domain-containing protein [Dehalococcoidia bacterium]|nr:MAG: transglutaminase domain-containing protein [Dehalococcoidia bacterium]